jgi:hypothetical protein
VGRPMRVIDEVIGGRTRMISSPHSYALHMSRYACRKRRPQSEPVVEGKTSVARRSPVPTPA